jgi:hypothetical protein
MDGWGWLRPASVSLENKLTLTNHKKANSNVSDWLLHHRNPLVTSRHTTSATCSGNSSCILEV